MATKAEDFVAGVIDEGRVFGVEIQAARALRWVKRPAAARHDQPGSRPALLVERNDIDTS
jgi:hypothetical protein